MSALTLLVLLKTKIDSWNWSELKTCVYVCIEIYTYIIITYSIHKQPKKTKVDLKKTGHFNMSRPPFPLKTCACFEGRVSVWRGKCIVFHIEHGGYTVCNRINISYLGKRKSIFKSAFLWDMLVPRRVGLWEPFHLPYMLAHIYQRLLTERIKQKPVWSCLP